MSLSYFKDWDYMSVCGGVQWTDFLKMPVHHRPSVNPLLNCFTGIRQKKNRLGLYGKQTNKKKRWKTTYDVNLSRAPGILRSLLCSPHSEVFCSFCCWLKNFVLFTCTVNAVPPLLVGEIKKRCEAAFILALVFSMADYCNPEKSLLFKLACSSLPWPLSLSIPFPSRKPCPYHSTCSTVHIWKILELPTKTYVGLLQNVPYFFIMCIPQMQALKQLTSWQPDLVLPSPPHPSLLYPS